MVRKCKARRSIHIAKHGSSKESYCLLYLVEKVGGSSSLYEGRAVIKEGWGQI